MGGKELFIIISLISFLFRSTSPKSKDTKVKREKDVKMEEEDQEEKKKEKVPPIMEQFISRWLWYLLCLFLFSLFQSVSGSAIVSGGVAG